LSDPDRVEVLQIGGSEGDTLRASALSYAEREQVTALSAIINHLATGFSPD
jgi:spermidine synthase